MRPSLILWCDLETTGIDPQDEHGCILEASFELCFPSGKPILEATTPIAFPTAFPIGHIWTNHFTSGLMDECRRTGDDEPNPPPRRSDFDVLFATVLERERNDKNAVIYLAGSSIHFDRRWIREEFPFIEMELHYRMIDVRTLIMFLEFQGIDFHLKDGQNKSNIHRAKADREWAKRAYYRIEELWEGVKALDRLSRGMTDIVRPFPGGICERCNRPTPTEVKAVYHREDERFCSLCLQSFETPDGDMTIDQAAGVKP